ncbi:tripartite motif-containing protein 35-like [Pygocentrus nattereri]|uniref:B30.2/SPRY domain-containing protein n=1 Tax=Pygocentrus nattereri TaxID=42514 RepID=A0AAR2KL89_PYGNA|nr:tripartite motif-containing protein 35-like [Pygocentrus nattereri]
MESVLQAEHQAGGESGSPCPGRCSLCGHHDQTLSLFCLDDLVPVCGVCGESHTHDGHRVYPVEEAVHDCKGELERSVNMLQKRACKCELIKNTCQSAFKYNQCQAQQTEAQIREEFEKLHQFLREQEESRITALRQEEEEKQKKTEEPSEKVEEMMKLISDTIGAIEEMMDADDVDFQERYEGTIKRVWECQKKPRKIFRTLIDVAKHVGNLRFKVWEKMLETASYFPVTLDPNSASTSLTVSRDLNQVQYKEGQQLSLPSIPERFNPYACVLGSEVTASGQQSWPYSWVVEVGQSSNWTLGVAKVSVKRGEMYEACPEEGLWTISLRDGEYRAMTSPCERLELNGHRPRRIRVCVDWKGGRVSFVDPDCDTHLYTFSHTFSEALLPYFESICPTQPLVLRPQSVSVVIQKHELPDEEEEEEDNKKVTEETSSHTA